MSAEKPMSTEQVGTSASPAKLRVRPADAELWHAYLRAISDYFPFSGTSDGYRIYTAPLTSFGVTIGKAVDPSIVNNDIFRLGDLLLPPNSPIFLPRLSYSKRLRRYLQAVATSPGRQDKESLAKLDEAKKKLDDATNDFIKCRQQAYAAFLSDPAYVRPVVGVSTTIGPQVSFENWVKKFYPTYHLASLRVDATSQEAYEAHLDHFGSQAASLWQDKVQLDRAFEAGEFNTPSSYNMPTSGAQVAREAVVGNGTQSTSLDVVYQPRYNIDAKFSEETLNWILNVGNSRNKPLEITFDSDSTSHPDSAGWKDLGFPKVSLAKNDEILARVPLFTAHTHEKTTPPEIPNYQVGLEDETTSVKVTIRASDAAVFAVGSDQSWDIPDITSRYPKLRADAPSDLFEPLVLVTHVLLGYQVSISMTLDEHTFCRIDKGIEKCQKHGGTASLFGLSVGPRSTTSTVGFDQIDRDPSMHTINVPARDNSQLTLIGLMGMKLAEPKPATSPEATARPAGP